MDRRELITTSAFSAAALVLGGLATDALAENKKKSTGEADTGNPFRKAIDTANACVTSGEICIAHCQQLMAKGDATLSRCLGTALEMVAACRAFATLASYNSTRTKKMAAICAELCRECEKACREHEGHHKICRECAESCAACAKECDKVSA